MPPQPRVRPEAGQGGLALPWHSGLTLRKAIRITHDWKVHEAEEAAALMTTGRKDMYVACLCQPPRARDCQTPGAGCPGMPGCAGCSKIDTWAIEKKSRSDENLICHARVGVCVVVRRQGPGRLLAAAAPGAGKCSGTCAIRQFWIRRWV